MNKVVILPAVIEPTRLTKFPPKAEDDTTDKSLEKTKIWLVVEFCMIHHRAEFSGRKYGTEAQARD